MLITQRDVDRAVRQARSEQEAKAGCGSVHLDEGTMMRAETLAVKACFRSDQRHGRAKFRRASNFSASFAF
jgi:hypothetical protein